LSGKQKTKSKFNIRRYFRFAEKGTRVDMPVLLITLTLLAFGLVMLYSASYVVGIYRFDGDSLHYIKDQVIFAAVGIGLMTFAASLDYHILRRYSVTFLIVVYILLVVVLFMPEIKGTTRWIIIPRIGSFQPSEFAKFAVILMFANMIEKNYNRMKTFRYGIVPYVSLLGSVVALFYLEPHMSAIVITCFIGVIMMFVGGVDIKWFIMAVLVMVAAIVITYITFPEIMDHVQPRIDAWLNPESDLQGKGYQTYQSILAIGSGGLFGLGLGNGRQKHLHLPEPQNDFIFSVVCEELGFFGGMMVIILFVALFLRSIYIATRAKDKFGAMLVVGISTQIAIQAFFNIAVATGTIPNTGISLPFFSEGGTSLMMLLAEMGVVLSVSRYANLDNGE